MIKYFQNNDPCKLFIVLKIQGKLQYVGFKHLCKYISYMYGHNFYISYTHAYMCINILIRVREREYMIFPNKLESSYFEGEAITITASSLYTNSAYERLKKLYF